MLENRIAGLRKQHYNTTTGEVFDLRTTTGLQDCGSMLLKYFSFVSICKYLMNAGLREQNINVTQSWPGILKFIIGQTKQQNQQAGPQLPARHAPSKVRVRAHAAFQCSRCSTMPFFKQRTNQSMRFIRTLYLLYNVFSDWCNLVQIYPLQ